MTLAARVAMQLNCDLRKPLGTQLADAMIAMCERQAVHSRYLGGVSEDACVAALMRGGLSLRQAEEYLGVR